MEQEFRQHLDWLQLELLKASVTGEAVGLVVPNQDQSDRQLAFDYFELVVAKLRANNMPVKVEHRPTHNGSVFFLTMVDDDQEGTI